MPSDPSDIVVALRDAERAFGGTRSGVAYEADLEPDDSEITTSPILSVHPAASR